MFGINNLFSEIRQTEVEKESLITRGKTVVDWLGVTKRSVNCKVINEVDHKNFFNLLKKELKKII